MITLDNDQLVVSFPEVHADARMSINFQRTLRIPDDNRSYPLPAGLGRFPLHNVDSYPDTVPAAWRDHGGVFLPMYQAEAMWLNFSGDYPFALKIAAGKINAVTGEDWAEGLVHDEQNYVAIPRQPWLDGFSVGEGLIRQFVAQPLGQGFTAEEQITGKAEHGGLQILAYPLRAEVWERILEERRRARRDRRNAVFNVGSAPDYCMAVACDAEPMGLAPGGLMKQEVYADTYGPDAYDTSAAARCFVHIANSVSYKAVTGKNPPIEPVTAEHYRNAGIPWFDYYQADAKVLKGSKKLAWLDSVANLKSKLGKFEEQPKIDIPPEQIRQLGHNPATVREGQF